MVDDERPQSDSFFGELRRRNVFRVAAAYIVAAWLVIQVAETIFPLFGFDETPARIVVIVLAICFVPALVFAWVFEVTPEGLKRERDIDRSRSITPQTGKKLDRTIIIILVVALTYFAFDKFLLDPARDRLRIEEARVEERTNAIIRSYGDQSIAVMPFADLSASGDQQYLSLGMAEEILSLLSRIPELRVISRSSAFAFEGKKLGISEIAAQLNVAYILEGSVQRSADRVRVTVQLVEGRSDRQIWSATYTQTLNDIFAVQESIATDVVQQIEPRLLDTDLSVRSHDPEAYSLLLQGNYLSNKIEESSLKSAIGLYEQALDIDPALSDAWLGIAESYDSLGTIGAMASADAQQKALRAVRKAEELEPDSARAQLILGWTSFNYEADYVEAARRFELALSLAPTDVRAIEFVASFLVGLGRLEPAIRLMEYVVARDPVDAIAHNNLGVVYRWNRLTDEAREALTVALTLEPEFSGAEYEIGLTYLMDGQPAQALEHFQQESSVPFSLVGSMMALQAMGLPEDARQVEEEAIVKYGDHVSFYIALSMAFQQRPDSAFEWLKIAKEKDDLGLPTANVEPILESLHSDSRWLPFLRQLGTSPEQLSAIDFDLPTILVETR